MLVDCAASSIERRAILTSPRLTSGVAATRLEIGFVILRGRSACSTGVVHVSWSRGNLPAAERQARRLLELCKANGRRDLISVAYHDLGAVLCWMKRYDDGLGIRTRRSRRLAARARDRIVNDIAFTLSNRGSHDAARCLLETLVTIGSEPVSLMCARINLIQVYGALGDRAKLERQRLELEEPAPHRARSDLFPSNAG